jgi:hypothetical protein
MVGGMQDWLAWGLRHVFGPEESGRDLDRLSDD